MFLNKLKKISFLNVLTVLIFFLSFLLAALDFKILDLLRENLSNLVPWKFWAAYFVSIYFLIKTTTYFLAMSKFIQLNKKDIGFKFFISCIKLFALGGYIGLLVNLSNAFVLVVFDKYLG